MNNREWKWPQTKNNSVFHIAGLFKVWPHSLQECLSAFNLVKWLVWLSFMNLVLWLVLFSVLNLVKLLVLYIYFQYIAMLIDLVVKKRDVTPRRVIRLDHSGTPIILTLTSLSSMDPSIIRLTINMYWMTGIKSKTGSLHHVKQNWQIPNFFMLSSRNLYQFFSNNSIISLN